MKDKLKILLNKIIKIPIRSVVLIFISVPILIAIGSYFFIDSITIKSINEFLSNFYTIVGTIISILLLDSVEKIKKQIKHDSNREFIHLNFLSSIEKDHENLNNQLEDAINNITDVMFWSNSNATERQCDILRTSKNFKELYALIYKHKKILVAKGIENKLTDEPTINSILSGLNKIDLNKYNDNTRSELKTLQSYLSNIQELSMIVYREIRERMINK